MKQNRREFLKGTAWMFAAAVATEGMGQGVKLTGGVGAPMQGFADKPLKRVRVGVLGLGGRGMPAVFRIAMIPGTVVTAVGEINPGKVAQAKKWLADNKYPEPKVFMGAEGYKAMCDWDGVDVIYSVLPWQYHVDVALCAMAHGKHVLNEVPGALTVEDCWRLVEASEKARRHCMMLENCVYSEYEMLALNLVRQGILGDIVHGEAGYIHDQRYLHAEDPRMWRPKLKPGEKTSAQMSWTMEYYAAHHGNYYPTHGLGPVARCMNINHGDRFEYLVSLESKAASMAHYGRERHGAGSWQAETKYVKGDMNLSLIRTAMGRSILLEHDVYSPRPYDRLCLISGTKGILRGYPELYMTWEEKAGDKRAHDYFDRAKTEEMRQKYKHPLWKAAGEIAKKVGGHGGMDFLMDLRWSYCLQNGLPLDTDVYDLASWSCLVELTERSVNGGSSRQEIPDFTRGAWKTAKPFADESIDMSKLDFSRAKGGSGQQTV